MGNSGLASLQKKYGDNGIDYVISKYHQRNALATINDKIKQIKQNANKLEKQDLNFISEQRKLFAVQFNQIKNQAIEKNPKSIQQAQARTKQPVQIFSGFNDELKKISKVQNDVKEKYQQQRIKMQETVNLQVKNYQKSASGLSNIVEYDQKPDNYKKSLQNQCLKKYPSRSNKVNPSDLHKKTQWTNYKQKFEVILDKQKFKKDLQEAQKNVVGNIIPQGAPVCC